MEGSSERASSAMTAVVRQFAPSRIECDLLAEVFELVYTKRSGEEVAGASTLTTGALAPVGTEHEQTGLHVAGRRVA
jgi:hypothetical protein